MMKKSRSSDKSIENENMLSPPVVLGSLQSCEPVLITISHSGEEHGEVSLITRGMLASLTNGWGLCFHEMLPEPENHQFTYLMCEDNTVTISRIGETASTVVHRAKETYVDSQETSKGTQSTSIFTHFVQIKRRGRTGQIRLSYQMNYGEATFPQTEIYSRRLNIRFRPCK